MVGYGDIILLSVDVKDFLKLDEKNLEKSLR